MTSSVRLTRASRCCSGVVASSVVAKQVGDLAQLGLHAGRDDLGEPGARRDRRAHEHGVVTLGERRVRGDRLGRLLDGQRSRRSERPRWRERVCLEQPCVRGDDVARFEHAARRPGTTWSPATSSTRRPSRTTRARGAVMRSQRQDGALGAMLLEEADERVEHDDRPRSRRRRRPRRARPRPRTRRAAAR